LLDSDVYQYSVQKFQHPICRSHQDFIREKLTGSTTQEAVRLYFALLQRGVPAELEKYDGYKQIDIAIVEAKVNIEVDGGHHIYSGHQALKDLQRTLYSFRKGYLTLRIPNSLIRSNLSEAVDLIIDFLDESLDQLEEEDSL
jgi:hypothetical protein